MGILADILAALAVAMLRAYFARADTKRVAVQEVAIEAQRLALVARDVFADPTIVVVLRDEGHRIGPAAPSASPPGPAG